MTKMFLDKREIIVVIHAEEYRAIMEINEQLQQAVWTLLSKRYLLNDSI